MDGVGPSGALEMHTSSWRPRQLAFRGYVPGGSESVEKKQPLRIDVRRRLVGRLTKDIVETYQTCNPQFKFSEELNPKRYLTSPSERVLNDGYDNVNSDLILAVNYTMANAKSQRRYIVKDILGHGTFGQVAKCWVPETGSSVAVKIIKNQTAYYQQALVEVSILSMINQKYDPEDSHNIVRIYDYFVHQRHLCICFELLDTNLFELIKINHFRGLSLTIVKLFSEQILRGLALLKDAGIIHCDLKPENILLCTSKSKVKPEVKIIDFGSACMENRTVYSYIQSRYYRSPEVLLGYQYTTAIDMWSFGCVVAELFLGLPLFPGASEFDLLRRMIEILGQQPPDYILKEAKNTSKFFKCVGSVHNLENDEIPFGGRSAYQVLSVEEYEARDMKKPSIGKEYFQRMNLEAIVKNYPYRKNLPQEEIIKESDARLALIDFLRGLVEFDPAKRWSPFQASKHPFLTGEPFSSPYRPPPETPRVPVTQNIKVEHHPGGGHWFAAGLSPNIPGRNIVSLHNSPYFQAVPYAHANSYGSIGSHGSYNDGIGLGTSYGSYGDGANAFPYYSPVGPSGMHMHAHAGLSMLGNSPDARQRMIQYNHGNGLGMSPSAGNFAPLPLGTSPSQFTPPSSYGKMCAGSPSHYGPPSPRSNSHGSTLGKMAAAGQFNRRKSWGYAGNPQYPETPSTSHRQGQVPDGISSSHVEKNPSILGSLPLHRHHVPATGNWTQHQGSGGAAAGHLAVQNIQFSQTEGLTHDTLDPSLPDPGDWDPYYSDDLLLQEDNADIGSIGMEFSRGMNLNSSDPPTSSVKYSPAMNIQRQNGPVQVSSQIDIGSPPSTHEFHSNFSRSMSKPSYFVPVVSQNSPSRLGQQHPPRFNHGRGSVRGGEWNQMKVHPPPPSSYNPGGPHSPGSGSSNSSPWGRRPSYPSTSIPLASRGRKDYGRNT